MTRDFLKPQKTTGLDTNAPVGKQSPFASRPFARIPRPEMSPQDIQTMRERAARVEQLGNPMMKAWGNLSPAVDSADQPSVQAKPEKPDLETMIQRGLRLGDPMAKAWANTQPTVQQQAMPEEEKEENLQTKSEPTLQREELPEEEEETLQMQSEADVQLKCQVDPPNPPSQAGQRQQGGSIQTKLTIGQPGDKYEQEADNMAAQVMSMADPTAQNLQRQETEEENLQPKPLTDSITPVVQRQTSETQPQDNASQNLETQLTTEKGGGSPLSDEVRGFMEPRFEADFSEVRVHTGSAAVQMNQQLGAQAFTHGNDIYYGKGKAPGNDALTAHELTHVVQQKGSKQIDTFRFNCDQVQPQLRPENAEEAILIQYLSDTQVKDAIRWYQERSDEYTPQIIEAIQNEIGFIEVKGVTEAKGELGQYTIQRIAEWQMNNPPLKVDGKVGSRTLPAMFATGLSRLDQIQEYVEGVKTIKISHLTDPENRKTEFMKEINKRFKAIKLPLCKSEIVEMNQDEWGSFDKSEWKMKLNKEAFEGAEINNKKITRMALIVYHESRHAEQHYTIARMLAGQGKSAQEIVYEMGIPKEIAEHAATGDQPIKKGTSEYLIAKNWYESRYGEGNRSREYILTELKNAVRQYFEAQKRSREARKAYKNSPTESNKEKRRLTSEERKAAYRRVKIWRKKYRNIPIEADAWRVHQAFQNAYTESNAPN